MGRLLVLLAAGAGAVLLLWAVLGAWQPPSDDPARIYYESERYMLQLEQDRESAVRWSAFWDVVLPLAGVLVLTAGAGLLVAGGWALWVRRSPLIDLPAVSMPVPRAALEAGRYQDLPVALLAARVEIARAQPPTPHTWSPHTVYTNRQDIQGAEAPPQLAPPAAVPTFAALLANGQIGAGQPLLLGYGADGPLTGALKDWRSGCVAGLPGAGKSTSQRFYAAQAALLGAKIAIVDPHGDASDPSETLAGGLAALAPAFLAEPATSPAAMLQMLRLVHDIMERRLHGEQAAYPVFAFVDEGTALLGHHEIGPELARLLESITLQGRKTLVQCVLAGQGFGSERVPTTLRDNLSTCLVHRMKRNQARLLLPTEEARKVETLPTGGAVLWRADGTLADITIPYTSSADMAAVGRLLTQDAAPRADRGAGGVLIDGAPWWEKAAAGSAPDQQNISTSTPVISTPADPYVTRVIACFLSGLDIKATVEALHPEIDTKSSGMIYRRKKIELEDIIRVELRRRSEHRGESI